MSWFNKKQKQLHPESTEEIAFWARKWRVTQRRLNEAIYFTGSTDIETLHAYLEKRRPGNAWWRFLRLTTG